MAKVTLVGDRMKLGFKGTGLVQIQSPFGDTQVLAKPEVCNWGPFRLEEVQCNKYSVNKYSGFDADCLLSPLGTG